MSNSLKLNHNTKLESENEYRNWHKGAFNFLLQRTHNHYLKFPTSIRRFDSEIELKTSLPPLTDEMLIELYKHASNKYMNQCINNYSNTGFSSTKAEDTFLKTLTQIIEDHPEFKNLEIYPSTKFTKDLPRNFKMVVGNLVPDFLIYGLKSKGFSSVIFEIDGDCHIDKHSKDITRYKLLEGLNVLPLSIPNDKTSDYDYILTVIKELNRTRSGALDKQILRHKRSIWCKTIACQLSLSEIDSYVLEHFNVKLNFLDEVKPLLVHRNCPRNIKAELKNILKPKI